MVRNNKKQTVFVIDDDVELCELVERYLKKHDFAVELAHRGDEAVQRMQSWSPDLVVLDLMLPGIDGLTVCREIRSRFVGPILMFTALTEEIDEVAGLESGADDYLKKPVSPRLLLARIRTLLRRSSPPVKPDTGDEILLGDLLVSSSRRSVQLAGVDVSVSTVEFDLLHLLVSNAGAVVTRQDMFETLRSLDYDGLDRSVDLYVSRLRKKLGDDAKMPNRIKTVRGVGYQFAS